MRSYKLNSILNIKVLAVTSVLALSACGSMNTQEAPEVSPEGMELVKNTRSTIAYRKEGVNFADYDKIQISNSTVAFKKNWQRDYNRDQRTLSTKINDREVVRIKESVAKLFDETFTEEFTKSSNYKITDQAVAGTLLLKPAIINLDINAPDILTATNIKTYVDTAGEATLYLEMYDAVSGEILARIVDSKEARDKGYYQWATRVSNRQDAKIIIRKWAKSLRTKFDEVHAK